MFSVCNVCLSLSREREGGMEEGREGLRDGGSERGWEGESERREDDN